MGLDSYLVKKTYVQNWEHTPAEKRWTVTVVDGAGQPHPAIQPPRVSYITEELAYWRKFNALHQWFVAHCAEGVDDCQPVYVAREQLQELLDTLKRVRNAQDTVTVDEVAARLLPTQSGFFFGSTDYDAWYFEDVERTIPVLEEILHEPEAEASSFYYEASW